MSKEIHKVDYKAQPKVNREWWETLKKRVNEKVRMQLF